MTHLIGNIISNDGTFFAKSVNGSMRELLVGDKIFEGESIVGGEANSVDKGIVVSLFDGSNITLIGNQSQIFDASLSDKSFSNEETVIKSDSISSMKEIVVEGLDALLVSDNMNIDFSIIEDKVSYENKDLGSVSIDDILNVSSTDDILDIDASDLDDVHLKTKVNTQTSQNNHEYVTIESDSTVNLVINTNVEIYES